MFHYFHVMRLRGFADEPKCQYLSVHCCSQLLEFVEIIMTKNQEKVSELNNYFQLFSFFYQAYEGD